MIQTVLLDVSGVLYQGAQAIPRAVEALTRSRSNSRQLRFLTNSTRQPMHRIMSQAYRLMQKGAPLLALASNRISLDENRQLSLDAGCFVKALEHTPGLQAQLLGKPDPGFSEPRLPLQVSNLSNPR
ncbi:hypothetical protein [Ruegeria atlantica]|uniref:hypothetical protein n=1 Tax=Ruegeria atlantica TaxID=81569 RepID=UPI0024952CDB|nr:hypothetical protein [Ruegeria atlantica]